MKFRLFKHRVVRLVLGVYVVLAPFTAFANSGSQGGLIDLLLNTGQVTITGSITNTCIAKHQPDLNPIVPTRTVVTISELPMTTGSGASDEDDEQYRFRISGKILDGAGYVGLIEKDFVIDDDSDSNDYTDKLKFTIKSKLQQNAEIKEIPGQYQVKVKLTFRLDKKNGEPVLLMEQKLKDKKCLVEPSPEKVVVVGGPERALEDVFTLQQTFDNLLSGSDPVKVIYVATYDINTDGSNFETTLDPTLGPPYYATGYYFKDGMPTLVFDLITDIVFVPQASLIPAAVAPPNGYLHPLSGTTNALVTNPNSFIQNFVGYGSQNGVNYGVPVKLDLKTLLWYRKDVFDQKGYQVPNSFDELVTLSNQIIADNEYSPFCVGIESEIATGWVITDWVEDMMLGYYSIQDYDDWVTNDLPGGFTNPKVIDAWSRVIDFLRTPGVVFNPAPGDVGEFVLTNQFFDSVFEFGLDDVCLMHKQASFISFLDFVSPFEIDVALFPGAGPGVRDNLMGSGVHSAALKNTNNSLNSDVDKVMQYLASVDFGDVRRAASLANGVDGFYSAHKGVDLSLYFGSELKIQTLLVNANGLSFDASDLMPPPVNGNTFYDPPPGGFWGEAARTVIGDGLVADYFGFPIDGKSVICAAHTVQQLFCSLDNTKGGCPAPPIPANCPNLGS